MPSRLSSRRAPKVSLNRSTVVEIKRKGCKPKKQTLLLNFDKNDLRQLMSCVERALHKSPSDPTVRVTSLSYLPAEAKVTSSGGEGGGGGGSVLDGTPFYPKSQQKKKSGGSSSNNKGNRSNKFVRLTVENFDPGLFLAMEEVRLAAVVVQEGEEEIEKRDVINDENDRRLSNGSASTSPASPADRRAGLSIGGSGKSPRSPSSPATPRSPPGAGATSRTGPPQAGHRSSTACPTVACAGSSGGDGGSGPFGGAPLSPMDRSDESGGGGGGGDGGGEFVLSVARAEASSPGISALSSRAGSVDADQGAIGAAAAENGEGEHADEDHKKISSSLYRNGSGSSSGSSGGGGGGGGGGRSSGSGSDEGSLDPTVGEKSATSCSPSCATTPAPGHGEAKGHGGETPLASPAPGRRSILFRRASAASQLPPDMTGDDTESGSDGGIDGEANGGERGSGADQSEGGRGQSGGSGSTASSGVWKRADLAAGGGGGGGDRPAGRRDAVGKGQARQRGRGSDKDKECTRRGGRREVVSGSASSRTKTGSGRSGSGRAAGAAKGDGGRRGGGDQAGGRSGDAGVKAQQKRPATKKKELFPKDSAAARNTKTGTKSAVSQPGAPKKRGDPTTPSCKKKTVDRTGTPSTASTTKSNPTCAKQRQQQRQLGTTNATTTTPRKAQPADNTTTPRKQATPQPRSAWAAKPSERRQPPFKAVGTPKAKLPLRTNAAPPTKSPRPKGGAAASGRGGESGGSGGGDGHATGSDGGEGSPSPSKRPPPRVSASGHMAWERNLRSAVSSTPSKKHATNSTRAKTDTLRGGARKGGGYGTGRHGGGGGGGGGGGRGGGEGGGEGGHGEEGRPSLGTWSTAQKYLQILKEISGKDDEELKWLVVAKQGKGVLTSEKRRESAETEYHRLLCEESMHKAGLELLRDRRLEVALKKVGKLGDDLELVSELLEELGSKEMALMEKAEEAQHQESARVDAAAVAAEQAAQAAKDATMEAEAALTAAASAASLEEQGGAEECGGESAAASAAAAAAVAAVDAQEAADKKEAEALAAAASVEKATQEAAAARASRDEERGSVERAREEAEAKLGRVLEDIGVGKEMLRALGAVIKEECGKMPGGGASALETIMGVTASVCSSRDLIAPARAKSGLRGIEAAAKELAEVLNKTRSDSQSALSRMEKWRQRKEELPEYEKEVADQEKAWFAREEPANQKALRRMRALIPVGVTGLTVAQLEERAAKLGSLYPHELALRIKENRLLHWIVTHPDDIARSNFLKGDHAHFFTNLDKYDLVELRAILACLPGKFEVDGDGRKAAWRALFLQRAQNLVAQERGDTVSGGWDMAINARREVRLPPLTGEQARRKEYFYPTAAEVEERVRKLQDREQRLEAKKAQLTEVKDKLLPEAKEEYANVLEDTRHPANKEAFSAEDLRRARDEAKAEVDRLAKEAKRVEGDVASAQRALRESPYTVQSLRDEAAATRRLLSERARKARLLAKQQREKEEAQKAAAAAAVVATAAAAATAAASDAATKEQGDGAAGGDQDPSVATAAAAAAPALQEDESVRASPAAAVEEEDEVEQVEEGLEVEGAFDPDPELRSRFADKSSSLRFVTAEEDARMRKEELAKVFAAKAAEAAAAAAAATGGLSAGFPVAAAQDTSEGGDGAGADGEATAVATGGDGAVIQPLVDGGAASAAAAATGGSSGSLSKSEEAGATGQATAAEELIVGGGGHAKGRMKALGAVLEKTLSQSFFERAPPPGSAAAAAAVGGGVKARALMSPPRPSEKISAAGGGGAAAAILTPPCKPKSKFFRSIQSPPSTAGGQGVGGVGGRSTAPSSPPPPPPMMGLLSQIRARGEGGKAPAGIGGLLAQIRAKGGGGGDGDSSGVASLLTPPPPPPSLPQRSLFAAPAGPSKAAQGPPPDLLAHIRAKAAERQTAVE